MTQVRSERNRPTDLSVGRCEQSFRSLRYEETFSLTTRDEPPGCIETP